MTKAGTFTATLYWAETDEAEEVDFTAAFATIDELVVRANAIGASDYEPGFEVVGIVDNWTNTVLYNPNDLGTRVSL